MTHICTEEINIRKWAETDESCNIFTTPSQVSSLFGGAVRLLPFQRYLFLTSGQVNRHNVMISESVLSSKPELCNWQLGRKHFCKCLTFQQAKVRILAGAGKIFQQTREESAVSCSTLRNVVKSQGNGLCTPQKSCFVNPQDFSTLDATRSTRRFLIFPHESRMMSSLWSTTFPRKYFFLLTDFVSSATNTQIHSANFRSKTGILDDAESLCLPSSAKKRTKLLWNRRSCVLAFEGRKCPFHWNQSQLIVSINHMTDLNREILLFLIKNVNIKI